MQVEGSIGKHGHIPSHLQAFVRSSKRNSAPGPARHQSMAQQRWQRAAQGAYARVSGDRLAAAPAGAQAGPRASGRPSAPDNAAPAPHRHAARARSLCGSAAEAARAGAAAAVHSADGPRAPPAQLHGSCRFSSRSAPIRTAVAQASSTEGALIPPATPGLHAHRLPRRTGTHQGIASCRVRKLQGGDGRSLGGGAWSVADYSTALAQSPLPLTPFQLQHPRSTFAAQHTPEQVLEAQLAQQCADVAGGAGSSGGASPVETALAIARMVKQCTEQLRSTPLHLRCATASTLLLPSRGTSL